MSFVNLLQLPSVSYDEGLHVQRELIAARRGGTIADTLVLLEHPPVLTLGRNVGRENILVSDDLLRSRGVEIHQTNRGGDVTYHGPGQLVGYPILDLRGDLPGKRGPHLGPVHYVRLLEDVLIRACREFGVPAQRVAGRTGVWTVGGGSVLEKKIAAIGVHVSCGITSHGFALNVTTDLRDFDWIVPCGIADRAPTSLENEVDDPPLLAPTMANARNVVSRCFGAVFDRQMLAAVSPAQLLGRPDAENDPRAMPL